MVGEGNVVLRVIFIEVIFWIGFIFPLICWLVLPILSKRPCCVSWLIFLSSGDSFHAFNIKQLRLIILKTAFFPDFFTSFKTYALINMSFSQPWWTMERHNISSSFLRIRGQIRITHSFSDRRWNLYSGTERCRGRPVWHWNCRDPFHCNMSFNLAVDYVSGVFMKWSS